MTVISRRRFLGGVAAAGALGLAGGHELVRATLPALSPLPADPSKSGIEHVVVLMMENRSFDHFFGWMKDVNGADGKQAGLSYLDKAGHAHPTHYLPPDYQGCGFNDPDHSYEGGRIQYNNGACDGFLLDTANDVYAIGYYGRADLPFLGEAALSWTTFDRYFCAIMAETYPNRFYMHGARTDRRHNNFNTNNYLTIWDRLAEKGISRKYYFSDLPFIGLYGQRTASFSFTIDRFLADCASGQLPAVSFVDPRFEDEGSGTSGDDHPHADIRYGEWFMRQIYDAVTTSSVWSKTVFIINYDEWGGFYDHVPPPRTRDSDENPDIKEDHGLRGFRVPCVLMSPLARRGFVSHRVYDHTSILKMIEWRYDLAPLSLRDATANNIAEVLDFSLVDHPNTALPSLPTVPFHDSFVCSAASGGVPRLPEDAEWRPLRDKLRREGWKI